MRGPTLRSFSRLPAEPSANTRLQPSSQAARMLARWSTRWAGTERSNLCLGMPTMSPPSVASTGAAPPTSTVTRSPSTGSAPSGRLLPWIRQSRLPAGRGALMRLTLLAVVEALVPDVDHIAVLDDVVAALDPQ